MKLSVNAVLPAGLLLLSAVWSGAAGAAQLLNSSYDIARELFTEISPLFEKQWNAETSGRSADYPPVSRGPQNRRWRYYRDCGRMWSL